MAKATLKKVTEMMKSIDLCMFTTITGRGVSGSRPMSNNKDVKYDGTSYFFTWAKSRLAKDIQKNPQVGLSFTGSKMLQKLFISVSGKAKITTDRAKMEDHWNKDLEIWFKDGLDTPGIAMIQVDAKHIKYWHGMKEGELAL